MVAEFAGKQKRATGSRYADDGADVATVIGVTFCDMAGSAVIGWRAGFPFFCIYRIFDRRRKFVFGLPKMQLDHTASIQNELRGLKNTQMWITLAVGAIGFGGLFSVYSYVSPILTEYTHTSIRVPFVCSWHVFGLAVGSRWCCHRSTLPIKT